MCISIVLLAVSCQKIFSLLCVGPISKVLFPPRFSTLSPFHLLVQPFSFARAPFSFCRFACLSLRKALINPREPASNKFRLEREKQQIWVRWCQLRRMRATSYLSYFSARLLWLLRYYGELPTRTCTDKYVHTYVSRVYARTDKYMHKVFQKFSARFEMSIIFWIAKVGVQAFTNISKYLTFGVNTSIDT